VLPRPRSVTEWSERWQPPERLPGQVEARLLAAGAPVKRGGHFDRWDLEVRAGPLGRARLRAAVEEHGAGRQLIRYRIWPVLPLGAPLVAGVLVGMAVIAAFAAPVAAAASLAVALLLSARSLYDAARAVGELMDAAIPQAGVATST
jgi:hypothetical protein